MVSCDDATVGVDDVFDHLCYPGSDRDGRGGTPRWRSSGSPRCGGDCWPSPRHIPVRTCRWPPSGIAPGRRGARLVGHSSGSAPRRRADAARFSEAEILSTIAAHVAATGDVRGDSYQRAARDRGWACLETVNNRCGTWHDALVAAEMEVVRPCDVVAERSATRIYTTSWSGTSPTPPELARWPRAGSMCEIQPSGSGHRHSPGRRLVPVTPLGQASRRFSCPGGMGAWLWRD